VDAIDGWEVQLHEAAGDGFVGEEHALFDELMGDVVFVAVDTKDATAVGFCSRGSRGRGSRF
jgi:hypothetical protein